MLHYFSNHETNKKSPLVWLLLAGMCFIISLYHLDKLENNASNQNSADIQKKIYELKIGIGYKYILEKYQDQLPVDSSNMNIASPFDNLISELVDTREDNFIDSLLYILLRHYDKKTIDKNDIEVLRKNTNINILDEPHAANKFASAIEGIYINDKITLFELTDIYDYFKNIYNNTNQEGLIQLTYLILLSDVEKELSQHGEKYTEYSSDLNHICYNYILSMGILSLTGIIVLLVSMYSWIIYRMYKKDGGAAPLKHPIYIKSQAVAGKFILVFMTMFLFADIPMQFLSLYTGYYLRSKSIYLLSLPIFLFIHLKLYNLLMRMIQINIYKLLNLQQSIFYYLKWAIWGFFANFSVIALASILSIVIAPYFPFPNHPISDWITSNASTLDILKLFFLAGIAAPITEEILFRGVLFPAAIRRFSSPVQAAVFTGLIFAMLHPQGPTAWPVLTAIGAMFCMLTYQTRSIIPGIIAHALHNSFILYVSLLPNQMSDSLLGMIFQTLKNIL